MTSSLVLVALFGVISKTLVNGLDNGLALTPPMGWLTWERYECSQAMNETLVMTMAKVMKEQGYVDAGYNYITIDDCWLASQRDSQERLQADPIRFPHGIKALADFVHKQGMKFGIYEDFGTATCAGKPGSEFYMETDANTFAEWGVDLLKFDGCNSHVEDMKYGYPIMSKFLNLTGRHILYSCEWPLYEQIKFKKTSDYATIAKYCNMWRNFNDVQDSWDSISSIINYYGQNVGHFLEEAGPGQWNDPDMLVVGDYGLSYDQQRLQMGMWCMMASPLIMSVDLTKIRPESKALLLNKNLIAINQDPLGKQAMPITGTKLQLWVRPLSGGKFAVALLNFAQDGGPRKDGFFIAEITRDKVSKYNVIEVFEGKFQGTYNATEFVSADVNPTGIQMFRLEPAH